jgi:catecholate siderophore receptor
MELRVMRRLSLLPASLVLIFVASLSAAAQPGFTFKGTVVDSTGAPIGGARVTIDAGTAAASEAGVSDRSGVFSLTLGPGRHTVAVASDGFEPLTVAVDASSAGTESRTLTLQIAGFHDTVQVAAPPRYVAPAVTSATKTLTALRDVPQSVTVITRQLMADQLMQSIGDAIRYVPGVSVHQGENNRDQVIIRGNNSSADFFLNGVRDDVQYYRDLYNLERVEAIKGPNATMFGRGGGGGVVNRVTKEAGFMPLQELSIQGGTYRDRRVAGDVNQPIGDRVAFRLNGMYENDRSFRSGVTLERYGLNPTFTVAPNGKTKLTFGYENLYDHRVSDRGIPSFQGRPIDVDPSTVYGNPALGWVNARVNLFSATIDHEEGRLHFHNRTLVGDYDRGYQNFVPGAVSGNGALVTMTAYNNATSRTNVFNQTDATYPLMTGRLTHTLLAGVEFGTQLTDNLRNTGFFHNTSTSIVIPLSNTLVTTPVTFRPAATDADNHLRTNVAAVYTQDQIDVSRTVKVVAGVRYDYFDLNYHDNRSGLDLGRPDNLVSPRAAVIYKPVDPVSVYSSYTVSYLPSSGDQFSSLTVVTQQLKPERFSNYEAGAKWDVRKNLSVNAAVYRLDRTNTRSTDPNDPTRIVQTGSQQTNGFEVGVAGDATRAWQIAGGYAWQRASVTSATASAALGAIVAQVPRHTLSLWNRYQFAPRVGAGLGVLYRSDMFAAIDDTVTLPGYVRADAAVFLTLTAKLRLQANLENVFDKRYFINADSNTNISPGFPRALRVALVTRF